MKDEHRLVPLQLLTSEVMVDFIEKGSRKTSGLSSRYQTPTVIDFKERIVASAGHNLPRSRSSVYHRKSYRNDSTEKSKAFTVWDIKPLDLSIKLYSNEKNISKTRVSTDDQSPAEQNPSAARPADYSVPKIELPILLKDKKKDTRTFKTHFRSTSPFTAKIRSINDGTLPKEEYIPQGRFLFRGESYCPSNDSKQIIDKDFTTHKVKDPRNLKFRNEMLQMTIPELSSAKALKFRDCVSEAIPKLILGPKWTKELYLKNQAYKRGRSPKSALYERIEENLEKCRGIKHPEIALMRPDITDFKTIDFLHITGRRERIRN